MANWVKTPEAEKILGIKRDTLKRYYANPDKGFLVEGTHWKRGMYHNSSKYWNINACRVTLLAKGFIFTNVTERESIVSH